MGSDSNQNNEEKTVDLVAHNNENEEEDGCYKIHISRVPTKFNEEIIERILKEALQLNNQNQQKDKHEDNHQDEDIELTVELIYPLDNTEEEEQEDKYIDDHQNATIKEHKETGETYVDDGNGNEYENNNNNNGDDKAIEETTTKEHRGFGFVTFKSYEIQQRAINLQTIKGGRKVTSTKKRTMYIRPYDNSSETSDAGDNNTTTSIKNQCYLWQQYRCPYGEECKFNHTGPGGCKIINSTGDDDDDEAQKKKKKGRCFAYKKGKCKKGDDCPFSHDFIPNKEKMNCMMIDDTLKKNNDTQKQPRDRPDSEKDCINWKTKGKCRKGDKCPYKHDPDKLKKKKKRKNNNDSTQEEEEEAGDSNNKKQKQPLSVRVFGLNYETTIDDVKDFFKDCGMIHSIEFPTFEDSGRSKGYCEIKFCSPKAVTKAIDMDGSELMGRWLQIQVGKMYLKQWESNHHHNNNKKQRMM